jgi:enoyl-[acyl-carrier-protein] reductase (NADH)
MTAPNDNLIKQINELIETALNKPCHKQPSKSQKKLQEEFTSLSAKVNELDEAVATLETANNNKDSKFE